MLLLLEGQALHAACLAGALVLALAIDRWLGEPPLRWHPVVWMGRWLDWAGARLAPAVGQAPERSTQAVFWQAAWAWCLSACAVLALAAALQWVLLLLPPWVAALGLGLALKPLLAWAMLRDEVLAVEQALGQSLPAGQEHLARLVSRPVDALDAAQVREGAIETLAENLNDSVLAPLFWFVLLGLPGAALFRWANTADAMWGYAGVRGGRDWQWAGKWAARADDVLACLPARLTALLLLLLGGLRGGLRLRSEARRTPSPNGGWPMAAMALALNVRLSKPATYVLNPGAPAPRPTDSLRACALGSRVVWVAGLLACLCLLWAGWAAG